MPYTLQFGTRAHVVDDATAALVKKALRNREALVDVMIDAAGDGVEMEFSLNVAAVVALVKHRQPSDVGFTLRARNALRAFEEVFDGRLASCDVAERRAVLARLGPMVANASAALREAEGDGA